MRLAQTEVLAAMASGGSGETAKVSGPHFINHPDLASSVRPGLREPPSRGSCVALLLLSLH
jgi:hypothetical protein